MNARIVLAAGAFALTACGGASLFPSGVDRAALGGATTVDDSGPRAFAFPARNLDDRGRSRFAEGDHLFNRSWITAPASVEGGDGLGPTFNATSCSACHLRDGRGAPPVLPREEVLALLLRLSVPGKDAHGGPLGEPTYGGQLQPYAIHRVEAEGTPRVAYDTIDGAYGDGEAYTLVRPRVTIEDLAFGPMAPDVMISPRVAPATFGLGLLEAVPEAALRALADPDDADGDGISGRVNVVWDAVRGVPAVGRFGWKSNQPSLRQQTAGASLGDIGITTSLFGEENCPEAQAACRAAPTGGAPELGDEKLDPLTFYGQTLAVPARREPDAHADGEAAFLTMGCASCHVATLETDPRAEISALAGQTIMPFTDLLLHDMGPELADGRPDFEADGREWRTAPLWGVGLIPTVSKHDRLLHDGRARGLAEAILWHGGEAEAAREAFRTAPKAEREALLAFLRTL